MILTEDQQEELTQRLSKLDDNYICFGNIFAEVSDIVKVVADYLEELN